jgi:hypothetical protein
MRRSERSRGRLVSGALRWRRRIATSIALLGCLGAAPASAQKTGEYRKFIDAGVDEFAHGDFAEAHAMFERAHAAQPGARTRAAWRCRCSSSADIEVVVLG